jgi:hypothetical protein
MEATYIQWNVVNWITIVLMASVGAVLLGAVVAGIKTYYPAASDA